MIAVVNLMALVLGIIGALGLKTIFLIDIPGPLGKGHPGFLSLAVAAIALVTFFGALRLGQGAALPSDAHIRRAITLTVVTVYIVVVSVAIFYVPWAEEFGEVSKTLLNSFTATVSVIVVFFFGSSAYVETRTQGKQQETGTAKQQGDG